MDTKIFGTPEMPNEKKELPSAENIKTVGDLQIENAYVRPGSGRLSYQGGLIQGLYDPESAAARAHLMHVVNPQKTVELPSELIESVEEWEPQIKTIDNQGGQLLDEANLEKSFIPFSDDCEMFFSLIYHYKETHNNEETFFDSLELRQIIKKGEDLKKKGVEFLDNGLSGVNLEKLGLLVVKIKEEIKLLEKFLNSELTKKYGGFSLALMNLLSSMETEIGKLPGTEEIQSFITKGLPELKRLILIFSETEDLAPNIRGISRMNIFDDTTKQYHWNSLQKVIMKIIESLRLKYEGLKKADFEDHNVEILRYYQWVKNFDIVQQLKNKIDSCEFYLMQLYDLKGDLTNKILQHKNFDKRSRGVV
jgi:hypothetical protein